MDERIAKINRFITGWMGYFQLSDASRPFRDMEEWLRRRMRQIRWKEWKRYAADAGTCSRSGFPTAPPVSGRAAAKVTGGSRALASSSGRCPTPTGTTWA
jgi:hypothetical protein